MNGTEMFDAIAHIDEDLIDRCLKADTVKADTAEVNEMEETELHPEQAHTERRRTILSFAGLAAAVVGVIALVSVLHVGGLSHKTDNAEGNGTSKVTEAPEPTAVPVYVLETPSPENAKFIGAWAGTDCNQAINLKEDGSFDIFTEGSDGKYVYAESGAYYLRGDVLGLYSAESGEYMESTVVYEADGQHLTMTNETGTMHFERVDLERLWESAADPTPDALEGYNAEDYAVMREFLEMTDESGVTNGSKLFPNYDPEDPATWIDGDYSNGFNSAVIWNDGGRASEIVLRGIADDRGIITDDMLRLAGSLALEKIPYLTRVDTWNVILEDATMYDIPTSENMELFQIRIPCITDEAVFYGGYIQRLYLRSAERTLVELTGKVDRETWTLPSFRIEVNVEGLGFAGVSACDDENCYLVSLVAEPFAGGEFLGWYDADGKLVSTEPIYELFGEDSGKHCEGANAELAFTARFSGTRSADETEALVLEGIRPYAENTADVLGLEFDYDNAEFTKHPGSEIVYTVRIPEKSGGALYVYDVKVNGNSIELAGGADLIPNGGSGHSSDYEAGESFRNTIITVTPQEIAASGCTATDGKAYIQAAYNVFAAKLAEMYVNADEDCPAKCTAAEVASVAESEGYEEYDIMLAVVPADPYAFYNYCDGLVCLRLEGEHAFRMMVFSQCRLTKNSDGSFSSPAFSYWGV